METVIKSKEFQIIVSTFYVPLLNLDLTKIYWLPHCYTFPLIYYKQEKVLTGHVANWDFAKFKLVMAALNSCNQSNLFKAATKPDKSH
jgi:hypothetical protein